MANFKSTTRYSRLDIKKNRDGKEFILLKKPIDLPIGTGDIFVVINQELIDRPDLISYRAYGIRDYWWAILEFNNIKDPMFELQIGQQLRIPPLSSVLEAVNSQKV